MSGRIVCVSGVPKYCGKSDLEIYFQSRKKSGGGDIEEIEFDPDRSEARIVFKESSAAKRVIAKAKHEYKGVRLTVVEEMQSTVDRRSERPDEEKLEDSECASVLVSGLSSKTTKDAIQMYFENARRSHGGDVIKVELNNDEAVVTFESPSVAEKVLEWGKHTLDGCPLTVTRPVQQRKTPSWDEEEEFEQPVQRSRVVRVTGISDKTTKDALLNFFENTRRSGGGEIEDIQHISEERLADITFCSPDDAERVSLKGGLELDGSKLTVTLKEIPKEIPKDPYKLHVKGIAEKTTKDGLESFMEVVSGEEVESVFFGSNSNAMITFKDQPDIDKVQKKCSTRALDGSHLKIEQVNICDCIEVTGLASYTTKDTVFYYFDNPKNGGEVKKVEMDSDDTRALVFFEDPSVVNIAVKGTHKINGVKLKVVPYYPFLGECSVEPGGGKKDKTVKVDSQTVEFINKFIRQEFDQLLQESRVKYKWQGSEEIVLGCAEHTMDKKTWENSCKAVVAFISQIVTEKITVSPEAWDDMCKKAKEKCASIRDKVAITCKEKERSFTLTGKESDVSVLAERLNDLKTEIEKQIEFEKNKISKSISLSEAQFELLGFSGLVIDLEARCKDLEVNLSKNDLTINFRGPDAVVKEGNITVWQTLSRVKDSEMELPKSIVDVVGSQPGKIFMATKFKKEHIDAVVSPDPNYGNQLLVTAVDRKDVKKAVDLIKDLTSEQSIPLDDHQKQLIHTEKWKQLKLSFRQSMLLQVIEEPTASTLWIGGIKEEVGKAKEKVDGFFEENIIIEANIGAENGRLKFIFKYKEDDIQSMEKSLTNQSVKIRKKTEEDEEVSAVVVSGTRNGIQQAVPKVEKLIEDIKERKVDLDKPGMKKLFSQKKGITLLSVVENDHKCIIERCTPSRGTKPNLLQNNEAGGFSQTICSYITPEGKKITLYKGDITKHRVDVMVNAANKRLQHVGGVARSIVVRGGTVIQKECDEFISRNGNLLDGEVFMSGVGSLPCKRLVHAVGPMWNSGANKRKLQGLETREERILCQTVLNSLNISKDFTSVALPAISSGVFGFPVDVCVQVLIESALEYSEENSHSRLSEIHFVDMNDSVIKAFHDEMKARFGKENSFSDGATPKVEARKGDNENGRGRGRRRGRGKARKPAKEETLTLPNELEETKGYDDPNSFTTVQGMKIMVIVGDLAKEEAHAIVNTVSSDLNLGKNPCAKALSNAAGPALQQECKRKGSLAAGQVLVTNGYQLGCKNVFHVVAGEWKNGQGELILRSLIQSCLKEADKLGFSSIAFPAIGTGNLGFPRDVVARAFFEEADAFKGKNPQSPLNEVHLILFHKDVPTVQAFQDELNSRKPKKAKGKRRSVVHKSEDNDDFGGGVSKDPYESFVNILDEDASTSASYLGTVRLEIISGDITKETTDAIAIVSNKHLNVAQGGVGTAIAKAGGTSIQKECNKLGTQKPGSVVHTSAGSLSTNKIFHLVSSSYKPADISEVVLKCFQKAETIGVESITVPAMGTGVAGIDPKDAAKALLSTIAKFSQEQPVALNHIRIVVFQEHMLQDFYSAIDDLSKLQSGIWGKLWRGFKDFFQGIIGSGASKSYAPSEPTTKESFDSSVLENMWLKVFAASNRDLSKAEDDIRELMKDHSSTKQIEHDAVGKLSDAQRERVMKMEAIHDTKIQIEKKSNRIIVRGASEDVTNATLAIYDILNEKTEEEHTRRYAELLAKNVQWYYVEDGVEEAYDGETNAQIEQAYKDKKQSVIVLLAGEDEKKPIRYLIDFDKMEERNLDTGDLTRVERKEAATGIRLPSHWDPQPTGSNGKELDVHLVELDPARAEHAKEYDCIKKAIEKTSPINIIKIERVQNPGLYKTYAVKKQKMDEKNGSNEKKLFHGTAPATCQLINHQGFNRSFCGKNATFFGKGVYFARDASYSMQPKYSPPDSAGTRCMYLASVLAGEYAQGSQDMVAPPPKNPSIPTITYDSVVSSVSDPSIFVIFHDTQNYPDYLITFR